ncbi:GntR family transcriptional regulator [Enterococcus sp. AZ126]|uniref:GntR family transcriptional regulator n=1 Tax=Enterococcus sp. AZ126 TaxID=2774635 RepID=UPI003F2844BC
MTQFKKIAEDLRLKINNNHFKVNEKLPKQSELAIFYNTSRMTISKALTILKLENLIYTKRGIGTFVKDSYTIYDTKFVGITTKVKTTQKPQSKIISFEVRFPNEIEQEKLRLSKNDPVYDIIRLRIKKEEPLLIEYTIMPAQLITAINEEILLSSIYQHIQGTLKLEIGAASRIIRADKPDAYDKKYLECTEYDPVLEIDQVVYLKTGEPFEYSQTRRRYDKGDCTIASF